MNLPSSFPLQFLWPEMLWLLLLIPLLVALYLWLLRRQRATALRLPTLSIVREALGPGRNLRRHVPPLLLLLALALLLLAGARPLAVVSLPMTQETIMLAMDVSGSMRATDVQPNRLVAAQNAAKAFLTQLPRNVKVGIVAFAGSAQVVQMPTVSREDLVAAIDRFQMQRGTAIGNGLVLSLATIFPEAGLDINAALVAQGHAWAWRDSRGRSPYLKQEAAARAAGRGAHADRTAEAPWDFRQRHGRCRR